MSYLNLPKLIGHRGVRGHAPENTLTAMKKSKDFALTWVEFDVQLSADNELVVIHDETLDRTTNGHGAVCKTPLKVIQSLDAGSWFHPNFLGEKIPTLQEIFQCLRDLKISANIEIKTHSGQEDLMVDLLLKTLNQEWPSNLPQPLISSFNYNFLNILRHKSKEVQIGLLLDEMTESWKELAESIKASTIHCNHVFLSSKIVALMKENNYPVLAYTVNDLKRANTLFSMGVSSLFTDNPEKLNNI